MFRSTVYDNFLEGCSLERLGLRVLQGQGVSAVHGLWLAKINIEALTITYIIPYYKNTNEGPYIKAEH